MATAQTVVNTALRWLGQPESTGVDDTSKVPRRCYAALPERSQLMLESHVWYFARKIVQLSAVTPPVAGWQYSFLIPPDCLREIQVQSAPDMLERPNIEYTIQDGYILTNSERTFLSYTSGEFASDYARWPAHAREALALDLADHVAAAMDVPVSRHDIIAQRAGRALKRARTMDSQRGPEIRLPRSRWQDVHYQSRSGTRRDG